MKSPKVFLKSFGMNNNNPKKFIDFGNFWQIAGRKILRYAFWDDLAGLGSFSSGNLLKIAEIKKILWIIVIHTKWLQKNFSSLDFEDGTEKSMFYPYP